MKILLQTPVLRAAARGDALEFDLGGKRTAHGGQARSLTSPRIRWSVYARWDGGSKGLASHSTRASRDDELPADSNGEAKWLKIRVTLVVRS